MLPSKTEWKRFFKIHGKMIAGGFVLGWLGATYYLKQIPRETLADLGRQTAIVGFELSPETKVFVAFVSLSLALAIVVSEVMDRWL